MHTLLILRHAKSSWKNPDLPDHQRPLNERGRSAAPRIGRLLREMDLVPHLIVSSTATRARMTAELIAESSGFNGPMEFLAELYEAGPATHREVLRGVSDAFQIVLLVGHNPGLEELLTDLTGETERLPTGALARVTIDANQWGDLEFDGKAVLTDLWRPKELD